MKHGKKLTSKQKTLLSYNGYDCNDYLFEKMVYENIDHPGHRLNTHGSKITYCQFIRRDNNERLKLEEK